MRFSCPEGRESGGWGWAGSSPDVQDSGRKVGFPGCGGFPPALGPRRLRFPRGDAGTRLRHRWQHSRSGDTPPPCFFKSLGRLEVGAVVRVVLDSRVLRPRPFLMWEGPGPLVRLGSAAAAGRAGAGRGLGCRARGSRPGGGGGKGGGSWPGLARAAARGAGIR